MNVILTAAALARYWHNGQVRKYNDRPYITHPARVAMEVTLTGGTEEMVAAAWLHDVLEDTNCPEAEVVMAAGMKVLELVVGLTNPSKQYPKLSRADRKKMDRDHIASSPAAVKWIKMLDRADNLNELDGASSDFKKLYLSESRQLLSVLAGTFTPAEERLDGAIKRLEATC